MKTNIHFLSYLIQFFLELETFQIKVVEKLDTHILHSITFSQNCAVYELMWKNMVQPDKPDHNIIWCMYAARLDVWGYRHKLRICNTYSFSTATMVMGMCLHVTIYIHCLSASFEANCSPYSIWSQLTAIPVQVDALLTNKSLSVMQ